MEELNKIYNEPCEKTLQRLPDESVNCIVTSPPYWGLRDYGHNGQMGLEPTPEAYIEKMVNIFREARRVLKKDGTVWLNLGDSFFSKRGDKVVDSLRGDKSLHGFLKGTAVRPGFPEYAKPKDLVGIPWRVAFALQAEGWYLRQDIIWHKPNPMPESVKDRCTKAHEYIFLLSKSARYFYDAEAIAENIKESTLERAKYPWKGITDDNSNGARSGSTFKKMANEETNFCLVGKNGKRNKRSVWTLPTRPYSEAHFATFPIELPSMCILAGCPEGGIVYDPFMGAGTTALAAIKYRRLFIGSEINSEYCAIAEKRLAPHLNQLQLAI